MKTPVSIARYRRLREQHPETAIATAPPGLGALIVQVARLSARAAIEEHELRHHRVRRKAAHLDLDHHFDREDLGVRP